MAKFCANCGSQMDENAPFCPNCGAKQAAPQQAAPQQAAAPQKQPINVDLSFMKKKIENPLFIIGALVSAIVAFFIKLTPVLGIEGGSNATLFYMARSNFIDKTALYVFMMIFLIVMVGTAGWLAFKHFFRRDVTALDMIISFAGFFLMFLITIIAFPVIGGELGGLSSGPNVGGWILIFSEIAGLFFTVFSVVKSIIKK